MFAGHVGAGLALGSIDRRINVAALVLAACWLDVVLWTLVLLGRESAIIAPDDAHQHMVLFEFPYSHGLIASLAWSALAALAAAVMYPGPSDGKLRASLIVAAAVFSHWVLDLLVHVAELPIAGTRSAKVGLGLWRTLPVALTAEALLVFAGVWLFFRGARLSRRRMFGLSVLVGLTLIFTVLGMTVAPPPPSVSAMTASSLATICVLAGLTYWFARPATKVIG